MTRFVLALHPVPPVCWSGILAFSPDKLEALFATGAKWMDEAMGPDDMAMLGLSQNPQNKEQVSDLIKPSVCM